MARFGRSRANTEDSNFQYSAGASEASASANNRGNRSSTSTPNQREPVQGYAASAAAGGLGASMGVGGQGQRQQGQGVVGQQQHGHAHGRAQTPQGNMSVISGASGNTGMTGNTGVSSSGGGSSGRRYGRQKSITSGISTLFRRQPSPDITDEFQYGNIGGTRDPTGVHATRPPSASRGVSGGGMSVSVAGDDSAWSTIGDTTATTATSGRSSAPLKMMTKSPTAASSPNSRPSSRQKGRTTTPNRLRNRLATSPKQRKQQQQPGPQQYSQTQRDLLHKGAYDQTQAPVSPPRGNGNNNEAPAPVPLAQNSNAVSPGVGVVVTRDYGNGRDYVPGIAHSMSNTSSAIGDSTIGSDSANTGTTSLSREMSHQNNRNRSYNNQRSSNQNNNRQQQPRSMPQPAMSYDQSYGDETYGDETYDTNADRTMESEGYTEDGGDESTYRSDDDDESTYQSVDESTLEDTVDNNRRGGGGGRGQSGRDARRSQRDKHNNNNNNNNKKSSTPRSKGAGAGAKSPPQVRLPRRYRGFSTSISSLFLDESIVCGAMACCGLLLSARTEHLLNERNVKRGLTRRGAGGAAGRGKEGGRRAPSRILGIAWVVCILSVLATYAIWGFEDQKAAGYYEEWYDYDEYDDGYWNDDGNNNNNNNDNDQVNDDGNNNQDENQVDDWNNNQADDGNDQNAQDDAVNQADDGNQVADDGVQNDDANANYYAYDDAAAANNDDANANDYAYDDANAAVDDDAVQADDGAAQNNDDAAANQDDAANYYQDDYYANRKLSGKRKARRKKARKLESSFNASTTKDRHSFIGVMKMRDHKEYILDPIINLTSQAYTDLMAQFQDEEYLAEAAKFDQQLQQRKLEDETETDDAGVTSEYDDVDNSDYEQGQQARTIIVVCFLFLLGVIGRRRRMRTRFAILRSRAQDDHLYYAAVLTKNGTGTSGSLATPDNTVMENFHEREDKYDGACSHTLFGCYPVDSQLADYADYDENQDDDDKSTDDRSFSTSGTNQAKKKRRGGDFIARIMNAIFACCCGKMCQCWCQLFSICALAQEAREARLLLPPSMQRIDIITHQPFHEYAKDVNNIRRRFMEHGNRTWVQHWAALSNLSRYLILGFVLITAFVVGVMFIHPMGGFDWGDALVLIATFTQSFLVLVIVFGIFHRSDLSFDAVVKFFAVGFCICVPAGFVLEGVLINGLVSLVYMGYWILHWIIGENFDYWMGDNHRVLWMIGELVNAFFVAAMVEELCKYFGFRFLEHPDLIFLTGLDRSAHQAQGSGGLDSYKYDSQLISDFSRSMESDGESVDSRGRRTRSKKRNRLRGRDGEEEEEPELRTLQQQAAAITTGMISVAVGLACAENFLYVFFLGGTGGDIGRISGELAILLFRSFFPVHALAAAMQSINMVHKFIEEKHGGSKHMGVGRIIFPAVLLHGTFDAILMCVNAYIEASWDNFYDQGGSDDDAVPYNVVVVNLAAFLGIIGVMAASFGWYSYQNKLQMLRLAKYDMETKRRSGRGGFNAPNLV